MSVPFSHKICLSRTTCKNQNESKGIPKLGGGSGGAGKCKTMQKIRKRNCIHVASYILT
jgi:hypothetical protein